MKVQTTSVTQTGNEILGTGDKTLWYLIIGEGENKVTLNVGEKTFTGVKQLIEQEQKINEKSKIINKN